MKPIVDRLVPAPRAGGFRMDGYYVWCGSLIRADGRYNMAMEDNQARLTGHERFGGHLVSEDGLHWRRHEHPCACTHDIVYDDGTRLTAERRERPELFNADADVKGNGPPTHLATAVLYRGETWNVVQPMAAA